MAKIHKLLKITGTAAVSSVSLLPCACSTGQNADDDGQKPLNIVYIMCDDHSYQTVSAYDGRFIDTPNIDRIATEGVRFTNSFVANSLSGPSRACLLTGKHSHKNGFTNNEHGVFDGSQQTVQQLLRDAGYTTAMVGKWHLVSEPTGFDYWNILTGQGDYYNPVFIDNGERKVMPGYCTNVTTDIALDWLENGRDKSKPFALIVGHKAPHRNWIVAPRHLELIKKYVAKLTPPSNLHDDWKDRPDFLSMSRQTVGWDMCNWNDNHLVKDEIPFEVMKEIVPNGMLKRMMEEGRFKDQVPADFDISKHQPKFAPKTNYDWSTDGMEPGLRELYRNFYATRTREFVQNFKKGKYKTQEDMTEQRWRWYMEDYLGVILAVDESVSNLLDYLDKHGLSENTLVIYVGDQGFYTGEHGLYDKRWIFEETFRMPLVMRWKGHIPAGKRSQAMVQEIDYAPTILELAGADTPENMKTFDGVSLAPLLKDGSAPEFEDRPLYYAFYEQPGEHNAPRHDGIRTKRYTLAHIWTPTPQEQQSGQRKPSNEWMLFDNEKDPAQMHNVSQKPEYAKTMEELKRIYEEQRAKYRVPQDSPGSTNPRPKFEPSWNK